MHETLWFCWYYNLESFKFMDSNISCAWTLFEMSICWHLNFRFKQIHANWCHKLSRFYSMCLKTACKISYSWSINEVKSSRLIGRMTQTSCDMEISETTDEIADMSDPMRMSLSNCVRQDIKYGSLHACLCGSYKYIWNQGAQSISTANNNTFIERRGCTLCYE